MKKKTNKIIRYFIFVFIILFFINDYSYAQISINNHYKSLIDSAHIAIVKKQDKIALEFYEKAFSIAIVKQPLELYEVASVCARLKLTDRCFMYLNWSIDKGLAYYEHFKTNINFLILENDPRYKKCLDMLRTNDSLYRDISMQLTKIYNSDQNIRKYYFGRLKEGMDSNSVEAKYILEIMGTVDAYNLSEIEKIVKEYGILGKRLKNYEAKEAISTIYIHAPLKAQKSILKKMEKSIREGEIDPSKYAYLMDKIMLKETGFQKYGSQYKIDNNKIIISPLIDSTNVDSYRKEAGLSSLKEYINYIKDIRQ